MTTEDILRLRDTAEQTRVQFFDKRSGNAERKERVTRGNKYDVSCEMVAQSNSRGGMIVVGIDGTRGRIVTFLNTELCMTNWYIGKRIKEDVLFNQRAEYGKQVIKNLSLRLIGRYGSGWSEKKLRHCIRSAETFSRESRVHGSSTQSIDFPNN